MSSRVATRLAAYFAEEGSTCLFAGAGVGKRAGFPLWSEYIETLVAVADRFEPETAALMRKRAASGHYLEALHLYKTCVLIPRGVLYAELARPFTTPPALNVNSLTSLVALPFDGITTTNYERSLHDAHQRLVTKSNSAFHIELGDASMRQAIYWNSFFIARVHGRAEVPETMVLDTDDYKRAAADASYTEFLLHILKTYRCLWIGYSFIDPAISRIFALMSDLLPQPYPRSHLAFIPSDAPSDLRAKLATFNVEVFEFDPSDGARELWEGIREVARSKPFTPERVAPIGEAIPGLRRLIASAYARLRIGRDIEPLREIVMEGIVTQALSTSQHRTRGEIAANVKQYVGLPDTDVERLVEMTLQRLVGQGIAKDDGDGISRVNDNGDSDLDAAVAALASGVTSRLKVREGIEATDEMRKVAREALYQLLLTRGWDLGAHYAGGRRDEFDAWDQIDVALATLIRTPSYRHRKALHYAMFDLLRHPDDVESALLSDLGRVAFAVELVINNSRTVIGASPFIPETLYLDANVVMPAIVDGHPYAPVYADTIARIHAAAHTLGQRLKVTVATDFLNEIVSHRQKAIEMVKELQLDDSEELRRHIVFYGAENTNVYVGAYGSWVGRAGTAVSFAEFLAKAAPYETEEQLERYLRARGILTEQLWFSTERVPLFLSVKAALEAAFSRDGTRWISPKAEILREHEARQLTQLLIKIDQRRPVLFVTADKMLMRAATGPVLGGCATAITSHLAFVQLVDLMLGVTTDKKALVRLMWNVRVDDTRTVIRNYLIDRALAFYDEAKAMAQWEVIETISDEAAAAAEHEGVPLLHGGADVARNAKFLDRFERKFYSSMEEVIREAEQRH